ncbi:MAG TPA: C45 family peptidase [Candidatus Acidoferrales bacterium]|nr:C45 family peptidase [Candidatus Acidoferrales bacterium]
MAVLVAASLLFAPNFLGHAAATGSRPRPTPNFQDSYVEFTKGKGYRFDRGGWIYVHLEGTPYDIGYQHGYLLATEIADAFATIRLEMTHDTGRDWEFFRRAARTMLWPKIDSEYQFELKGIVDGINAKGTKLDIDDIVALNAFSELPDYYVPWLNQQIHSAMSARDLEAFEHCSAFVATGSWTKDHGIVMAHNNWTSYLEGARWRIVFDIVPATGYRILMDGVPGVIASDDDFGVNSAGLMITETTIGNFHGWDPNGKAEFVRARKAMQYADSIDSYVKIMLDGNNGGYANDWLLGDRKTGEIARFELGLKHTKLWRASDGYFAGANFPSDPDVIKDETSFDPNNPAGSANARRIRWDQLLNGNKGKIDASLAEIFLADHFDTFTKKEGANRRTLCGHGDMESETLPGSTAPPFDPWGAVQGKVMDSHMAASMDFVARLGHPCGINFDAAKFLADHPEFSWQSPVMRDMDAGPWTEFRIGEHVPQAAQ